MNTWVTIYRYEIKKILKKKFVIAALIVVYAFIIFGSTVDLIGDVYINDIPYMSKLELIKFDRSNALALSERMLDAALMQETIDAYNKYHDVVAAYGDSPATEQKLLIADAYIEMFRPYSDVFDYCQKAMGLTVGELGNWKANESSFDYSVRNNLRKRFDLFRLSDGEVLNWMQNYEQIKKPITYEYDSAYTHIIAMVYAVSVLLMLLFGASLSGIFSDEHTLGCDQLVLSSKNGRGKLYFAKLAAGLTFAAAASIGLVIVSICLSFGLYGVEGFSAPLQLYQPFYPYNISIGWFCVIICAVMFVVIFLTSIIVMFLSACFRHGIIPMAVMTLAVITGMFLSIPKTMRVPSQIWDMLPINYLFANNIFDLRLISLFGHYFVSWQILPVIYIVFGVIAGGAGYLVYDNRINLSLKTFITENRRKYRF